MTIRLAVLLHKSRFITKCYTSNVLIFIYFCLLLARNFQYVVFMIKNCGIDFGTSNSALAVAIGGAVHIACVENDKITLPSTLFYPCNNKPQFGREAIRSFIDGEEGRFMRSLKRILGTPLMAQGTSINGKNVKFDTILTNFLSHIKTKAENQYNGTLENVVMGRPVHFIDGDDAADRRAQTELEQISKAVGFKNVEFQYEPIAAAFAHEQILIDEKLALVVDIGGGTSDFTVIRLSPKHKNKPDRANDILANTGIRIGGNDFDKDLCLSAFMPHLGYGTTYGEKNLPLPGSPFFDMSEWSKINFMYTPKILSHVMETYYQAHDKKKFSRFIKILKEETGHQLLSIVEDCKINLTDQAKAKTDMRFVEHGLKIQVTRAAFNDAINKHVAKIISAIMDCLGQAGINEKNIELVIMTGGTTEVPLLKKTVQKKFPKAAFSEENKLSSVSLGLGYDSLRRFGPST